MPQTFVSPAFREKESAGGQNLPLVASIVVPCRGQLEYTERCLARLLKHTTEQVEYFFLDLGSLDGSREFLRGAATASGARLQVTLCAHEAEFPGVFEQTLRAARGEFVVWLSNETLVTPGWLAGLSAAALATPGAGLVIPLANGMDWENEGELQQLDVLGGAPAVRYPTSGWGEPAGIDTFAVEWREKHRGQKCKLSSASEVCFLATRDAIQRLSPWGQWTLVARGSSRLAHLAMDELGESVRQSGMKLIGCREVLVYNFGSRGN